MKNGIQRATRREVLKFGVAASALSMPYINRAWAQTVELNMLAWYGHGEPDVVAEFEQANNVKFKPKYYAGGDNMLALIAQPPPGTYDVIPSDAELRIAQAQLVGWLEGLFHGIQTALFAQQMAARTQLEQMRQGALPPGMAAPGGGAHGTGQYL